MAGDNVMANAMAAGGRLGQTAPSCKGSWLIGTACGHCPRCYETAPETIKKLRDEVSELRAKNAEYYYADLKKEVKVGNTEALLMLLRTFGWSVAIHNDYRQDGHKMTFWLMTKGEVAYKGEGETDEKALGQIIDKVFKGDTILALTELCSVLEKVMSEKESK